MSREWKPGDVAMVTLASPGFSSKRGLGPHLMLRDVSGVKDVWRLASTGIVHEDAEVEDIRPLVVIDPEDREQVNRFRAIASEWADRVPYSDMREPGDMDHTDAMQAALREFADPTPPKPAEPTGLGAVIEDSSGLRWIRCHTTPDRAWEAVDGQSSTKRYSQVDAVRVLSEGVTQ